MTIRLHDHEHSLFSNFPCSVEVIRAADRCIVNSAVPQAATLRGVLMPLHLYGPEYLDHASETCVLSWIRGRHPSIWQSPGKTRPNRRVYLVITSFGMCSLITSLILSQPCNQACTHVIAWLATLGNACESKAYRTIEFTVQSMSKAHPMAKWKGVQPKNNLKSSPNVPACLTCAKPKMWRWVRHVSKLGTNGCLSHPAQQSR